MATPAQSAGPFYPVAFPADVDGDLMVLRGSEARAQGTVTHVTGRVLGSDGRSIPTQRLKSGSATCAAAISIHATRGANLADSAFQGYGRVKSASDGTYRFRTIRPVPYPGRTPHIHFAVQAPGRRKLVTQIYVAGEAQNERDGLYRSIRDPRQRAAVTVRLDDANGIEPGALAGSFDIVLA